MEESTFQHQYIVHSKDKNILKLLIIYSGYFITVTKNDLLNDLVSYRITDIEDIYDELSAANKIDDKTKELIQKMLDKI